MSCYGDRKGGPKQSFIGYMLYNRFWFHNDLFGLTLGGGTNQQSRAIPRPAAADQWRKRHYGGNEFAILYRESREPI